MDLGKFTDKAKSLADNDKVREGVEKIGEAVKERTGGKHREDEPAPEAKPEPEQLYRGKARGAVLRKVGNAGDGKATFEVTDPAGSDLEVGQSFLLAPEQVEKI